MKRRIGPALGMVLTVVFAILTVGQWWTTRDSEYWWVGVGIGALITVSMQAVTWADSAGGKQAELVGYVSVGVLTVAAAALGIGASAAIAEASSWSELSSLHSAAVARPTYMAVLVAAVMVVTVSRKVSTAGGEWEAAWNERMEADGSPGSDADALQHGESSRA